jgi:holo-[acyl-carrier protein] synthase
MMHLAVGTDIVAVPRIETLIRNRGASFLNRWFTAHEIDYCSGKAVPSRHFAARFAAKEAVLKALPVEWDGPPSVRLHGELLAAATRAGTSEISVSLSHCDEYATATALVTATSAGDPGHEDSPEADDAG